MFWVYQALIFMALAAGVSLLFPHAHIASLPIFVVLIAVSCGGAALLGQIKRRT